MATKKNNYITTELDWAEEQLATWRSYIDDNPMNTLKDRIGEKLTARGGVIPYVISNRENQGKFIQETMKNYLALLEVVNKLREQEENKQVEIRGKGEITGQANKWLQEKT